MTIKEFKKYIKNFDDDKEINIVKYKHTINTDGSPAIEIYSVPLDETYIEIDGNDNILLNSDKELGKFDFTFEEFKDAVLKEFLNFKPEWNYKKAYKNLKKILSVEPTTDSSRQMKIKDKTYWVDIWMLDRLTM